MNRLSVVRILFVVVGQRVRKETLVAHIVIDFAVSTVTIILIKPATQFIGQLGIVRIRRSGSRSGSGGSGGWRGGYGRRRAATRCRWGRSGGWRLREGASCPLGGRRLCLLQWRGGVSGLQTV